MEGSAMTVIIIAIIATFVGQSLFLWLIYDLVCALYETVNRMRDDEAERRRRAANKPCE